jgi:hypothetical protein
MFCAAITHLTNFRLPSVAVWRHATRAGVVSTLVLALSSCAVSPSGDGGSGTGSADGVRDLVTKRVHARWDALIKGDLDAAYAFESPGSKQAMTLQRFKRITRKEGFRSATIDKMDCDAVHCDVRLTVVYDVDKVKGLRTFVDEAWVVENGQAWYVDRR